MGAAGIFTSAASGIFQGVSAIEQLAAANKKAERDIEELQRRDSESVKVHDQNLQSRIASLRKVQGRTAVVAAASGVTGTSVEMMKSEAATRLTITNQFDSEAFAAERRSNIDARIQIRANQRTARVQTAFNVLGSLVDTGVQVGKGASALNAQTDAAARSNNVRKKQSDLEIVNMLIATEDQVEPL